MLDGKVGQIGISNIYSLAALQRIWNEAKVKPTELAAEDATKVAAYTALISVFFPLVLCLCELRRRPVLLRRLAWQHSSTILMKL